MFHAGLRAQFTSARAVAPRMIEAGSGLIVLTGFPGRTHYLGALPYDVIKAGVDRMVTGLAHELRDHGVTAVGVWPGFTRTEAVIESFAAGGQEPPPTTHSVDFPGRAVAMLLADPELASLSGAGRQAAEWAERYGFEDTDGRKIAPFAMPEELRLHDAQNV
jgi:NAD(P)-dependent dehydrogenase (short-subunit alcohol dehydrogenase family)